MPDPAADSAAVANLPLAVRDYALGELDAAAVQLARRGGRLHEGVHQARKSLRRARAVLALGDRALGPGMGLVDRELRRLNRGLSTLRDAHALVETLDRLAARSPDPEALRLLRRARRVAASARAEHARRVLVADPGLAGRRALLAVLRAGAAALDWPRLQAEDLQRAVAASRARMERAGARARAEGDDEAWHRWRRRARRLSQQRRALKTAGLKVRAPDLDRRIAERLGVAQDLALLLDHCGRDSPFAPDDRKALRRYGRDQQARARRRIEAALMESGGRGSAASAPSQPMAPKSASTDADRT
ncbi:CHAD domain-containing protein [Lysobacter sp. cf310]|uniref:CHAD domain-containing protein n=1 Tax=Lysobacter sp. cf310 TaxID=1761790 RepID=UPI0008EC5291|nr:CHAD domain-containing protein [Lysobacter sp. cf310]SFL06613.1 CHAD domain-containing protein [Lysobacter sp. cf310]